MIMSYTYKQELDFTVCVDNLLDDVKRFVHLVYPRIQNEDYVKFTDGITNKLIGVFPGGNREEGMLVKVFGHKTDSFIDRLSEEVAFYLLNKYDMARPLHHKFTNGLCYGFITGVTLDDKTVRDPIIAPLVAREMARLHSIAVQEALQQSLIDERPAFDIRKPFLRRTSENLFRAVSEHNIDKRPDFIKHFINYESLHKEVNSLIARIELLNLPLVLCHNDLLLKNIIFNADKNQVRFIDYEYVGFNFAAFDIGDHFSEYVGVAGMDFSLYPDKDYQLWWLKHYLTARNEFRSGDGPTFDVDDPDVLEKWHSDVNKGCLCAHVLWALWAIFQSHVSSIDFDYIGYAADKWNEYLRRKPEFLK